MLTTPHFRYTSASLQAVKIISFKLPLYNGVPKYGFRYFQIYILKILSLFHIVYYNVCEKLNYLFVIILPGKGLT